MRAFTRTFRRTAAATAVAVTSAVLAVAAPPASADAPPLVIRGYSPVLSNEWALAEGAHFAALRTALNDDTNFGEGGVVSRDVVIRPGVSSITAGSLLGVDVFVTSFRTSALTATEKTALQEFVLRGGALLAMTDAATTGASGAVGVTAGCSGATASTAGQLNSMLAAAAGGPLADGPFGTVSTFRTYGNVSCFPTLPASGSALARNDVSIQTSLATIPADGLATGSGPVVLVGDSDFASSAWLTAGATPDLTLAKNMVAWLAGDAAAVEPVDGTLTSTGQQLAVDLSTPADGTAQEVDGQALQVSGTASLTSLGDQALNVSYVVDVSGSTVQPNNMDCNGDGVVNAADNINGDGTVGDVLDCEITSVSALHAQIATLPGARVGVVGLGGASGIVEFGADVQPATGFQRSVAAGEEHSAGVTRAAHVVRSLRVGSIGQYTARSVGNLTFYDTALDSMLSQFASMPDGRRVAYFLSDGLPTAGQFNLTASGRLADAQAAGVLIHTFAVGANSGGCNATQPLAVIAQRTGGTCTYVVNPAALQATIAQPATLQGVEVQLGSAAPITVPVAADGTWTATVPAPGLLSGVQTLTASAIASDGTRDTATVQLRGMSRPVVDAGSDVAIPEGSTTTLAGSATDADGQSLDGQSLTVQWQPATNLSDDSVLSPVYTGIDDGVETLTLSATDPDDLVGSDNVIVTVQNVAPQLSGVGVSAPLVTGQAATVSGSFADPGTLDTHTITVDWGDGSAATVDPTATPGVFSYEHTYAAGGNYTVTVTATDSDGGTSRSAVDVSVNTTPEVDAGGPYSVNEGSTVTLDAAASDADNDPLTYLWAPSAGLDDASTEDPTFTAVDGPASFPLSLTVNDGRGLTAAEDSEITVLNVAPEVSGLSLPTGVVTPGTSVPLTASISDPGINDAVSVTVDWGDGSAAETVPVAANSISASHTYGAGGAFTVTVTATDKDGATGTATETVTTNRPPTVNAGSDVTLVEGDSYTLTASASDPDVGDSITYAWSPSTGLSANSVLSPELTAADNGVLSYTLMVTDAYGAQASDTVQVTVLNDPPAVESLGVPSGPVPIGTAVTLTATIVDAGTADTHTAVVDWGDGTTSPASVDARSVSATRTYPAAGVYEVIISATDDDGGSGSATYQYIVVYDPSAGFVTGGGTFASPAGAYAPDPALAGPASFGFTAKYTKGKTIPTGQTQFQFKAGDLRFHSTAYEWLVVSGSMAQYRGTGELNGTSGYRFQLTATDGQLRGSGGTDKLRMKILSPNGDVTYDNQVGAADNATPTTTLSGGSITIHS